ncbi:MAG: competence protein ComEA [bacterium]|nr:MAG: competence protein ComEA [bacterium]
MQKWFGGLLAGLLFSLSAWAAVDINSATQSELEAKAIVEHRQKSGPFKSVDDLDKVKGFGKASVDKLRNELTVGGDGGKAAAKK